MKNRLFVLLIIATLTQFTSILPERGIFSLLAGPFKDAPKDNLARCKQNIRDESDRAVRKKENFVLESVYENVCTDHVINPGMTEESGWLNRDGFEQFVYQFNKDIDNIKVDETLKLDYKNGSFAVDLDNGSFFSEEDFLYNPSENGCFLDRIASAKKVLADRGCLNPIIYWCIDRNISFAAANVTATDENGENINNNIFILTSKDGSAGFEHLMHHEATHWEKKDGIREAIIENNLAPMDIPQAYHSWKRELEKRADIYALTYVSNCVRNPLKKEMLLDDRDRSRHHQSPKATYLMYEDLKKRMRTAKEQDKIALVENVRKHADAERIMQETMCSY